MPTAAGYTARTDTAAETNASRLIKTDQVAGYLAERRAAAAEKASLSLAGVLADLVELARDKAMDGPSRVAAFKLALEHLARAAPAPALVRRPSEVARES